MHDNESRENVSSDSEGDSEEHASTFGVSRRTYLGGFVGGLGAAALGSDAVGTASAESGDGLTTSVPDAYLDRFSSVVDVTDVGADPTGREPVGEVLRDVVDDDTLVVFPEGRYLFNEQFRKTGYSNLGFYGPEATMVHGRIGALDGNYVTAGEFTGPARFFRLGVIYAPGEDLLFEGFTFDYTAPQTGIRAVEAYVTDGLEVRDITIAGEHDTGTFGPALFSVTTAGGEGVVERFKAPDGGAFSEDTIGDIWVGPTGMLIDPNSAGTLRIVDCELGRFPDNGLYGSGSNGTLKVEGGRFENSNVASIRLMGHGSSIRNATIVVDSALEDGSQRGIRLDEGSDLGVYDTAISLEDPNGEAIRIQNEVDSARIEGCTVDAPSDRPAGGVYIAENAGRIEIADTSFDLNGSDNAIEIRGRNAPDDSTVLVQNVDITGEAPGARARAAIRVTRANCRLEGLTINQPGSDYRRCVGIYADDCLLRDGTYESSHHPIINTGERTHLEGITARSFDGYQALKLYAEGSPVVVDGCVLYGGYRDRGVDPLFISGTEQPEV